MYSIIIPVYNEIKSIRILLEKIKPFRINLKNEIIVVDDGSDDGTEKILEKCDYIKLIRLQNNHGKGYAIKEGFKHSTKNKIILFDGDMELDPKLICQLMILTKKTRCVFGSRYNTFSPPSSFWDLGNIFFTWIFNFVNNTDYDDILCCAKSFYKEDIDLRKVKSNKFDIDVELASILDRKVKDIHIIPLVYSRRSGYEGKKLGVLDSYTILSRILSSY